MPKLNDLSGKRFLRLEVLPQHKFEKGNTKWLCKCDCGTIKWVQARALITGKTKSCGCFNRTKEARNFDWIKNRFNKYEISDGKAIVKFYNCDKTMICDADDWEKYRTYKWSVSKSTGYVEGRVDGKLRTFHSLIIECEKGKVRDHINRNKLDNRKENLRVVDYSTNNSNRDFKNKTGIRHCYFMKDGRINVNVFQDFHRKYLGIAKTKDEALMMIKQYYNEKGESINGYLCL